MPNIYALEGSEQKFAEIARQVADDYLRPISDEVDEQGRFPSESVKALGEAGLMGLCIPREQGGSKQPPRVLASVVEELAQACASTTMIYVMHVAASQCLISSNKLKDRETLLKQMAEGNHLTTLALSERGSRSQFWTPVSVLEKNGSDGYKMTAHKSWVTSAHHADSMVCSAQTLEAESPLQTTFYLAFTEGENVRVDGHFNGLGLRGNDSAPVDLENFPVSQENLLSAEGDGMSMLLEVVLPWFAVGTTAMAHGLCLAAIEKTSKHLSGAGFEHNQKQLRDLPNLRARLAEMSARTQQSRALLGYTLRALEQPDEQTPLWVLQSRLSALETALDVTDLAMKTCGGAAFSKQVGVERLFRDARAGWVMAPTADHLKDFVGRALTGLPLF